ncbi:hypothetical protein IHE44_0006266, partial [Lamprotornis superbus]
MDAFVVKLPRGEGKRPRLEEHGPERPPPREIRAEGLNYDLTKLHVFGTWHKIPRKKVTYGDPGLSYTYSGVTFHPKPWIPVLTRIRERVTSETGHTFNFVLINSPIASVSFGACRDFVFRRWDRRGKGGMAGTGRISHRQDGGTGRISHRQDGGTGRITLQLAHGSLLLMKHPTNLYWYHSLPPRRKVLAPRVNLTFRQILPSAKQGDVQPSLGSE